MKHQVIRLTGLVWVLVLAVAATAGTWSSNNFFYKPSMGARGPQEKTNFDTGLSRVDDHLGKYKTLGDPNYTTLAEALNTIDDTKVTLNIPSGIIPVNSTTTIPANIHLRVLRGAQFQVAEGANLTINGPIEAGPYQIFSWTGTGAINLKGSPTKEVYLQWWGAQEGRTNDCSAAFIKAWDSTGPHQDVRLTKGTWRLASAVTFNTSSAHDFGWGIIGDHPADTLIYIDVGSSNVGMTFGESGYSFDELRLKNLGIIGPANCCSSGIKIIRGAGMVIDNVNFYLGATEYAVRFQGCIDNRIHVSGGKTYWNRGDYASGAMYANFIKMELAPDGWQCNANKINLHHTGSGATTALEIESSWGETRPGHPIEISGIIEYCSSYPIKIKNCWNFGIHDMYLADGNDYGILIEDSRRGYINNLYGAADSKLSRCTTIQINNSSFTKLEIDAMCLDILLGNLEIDDANGLTDECPNTVYYGPVVDRLDAYVHKPVYPAKGNDSRNLINNATFERWRSDRPDGWNVSNSTWAKCGDGETDTTKHATPHCAKLATNGGNSYTNFDLANVLERIKGQYITYALWMKVPSGQTFSNYPGICIQTGAPTWTSNTSYKVGDVVRPSGGGSAIYLCAQAGTSHATTEPTWPGIGEKVTDNSVVWLGINAIPTNVHATPIVAGDLGKWKKVMVSGYVGKNVTSAYAKVDLYRQSDNANSAVYLAEPFVQVGTFGPSGVVEGKDEHEEYLVIGGRKISFGSAAPTSDWWNRGDVRFNIGAAASQAMGWMCVTAGSPGTWKAMANLAN